MEGALRTQTGVRPWRTAAVVCAGIALLELAALVSIGLVRFGGPLARSIRGHASPAAAQAAPTPTARRVATAPPVPKVARLARTKTRVLVLNGNGLAGAAGREARVLSGLGYRIGGTANAARTGYAASIVMFRAGYRPEASRLARDLGVHVVGPLDGIGPSRLHGSQLVVIVGD